MPIGWVVLRSRLAEVGEHRVDELKGVVDFFANLCASENDLARDEDQKDLMIC